MSTNDSPDPPPAGVAEWRRDRAASRRRLPGGIAFGLLLTAVLAVTYVIVGWAFHWWLYLLVLLAGWFGAAGDTMNIWYLDRHIAAAERDQQP
jgi:hypothetical protein